MDGNGNGHGNGHGGVTSTAVLEQPLIKSPFSISINQDFFSDRAGMAGTQNLPTALKEIAVEEEEQPREMPQDTAVAMPQEIPAPQASGRLMPLQMPVHTPRPQPQPQPTTPAIPEQEVRLQGAGAQQELPWKMLFFIAMGVLIWMWMDSKGKE